MTRALLLALLAVPALAACGQAEEESTANKAARLEREIGERAAAFNSQVENELAQTEQRLEREAGEALNSLNAVAGNAAAEEAPAAAGAANKQR
ncbi:MAG TPA: hypothetical protein VMG08_10105 [Allosphingosinicella sp.]|nr:hypothetical protein [Allosphingosinicella sp.]